MYESLKSSGRYSGDHGEATLRVELKELIHSAEWWGIENWHFNGTVDACVDRIRSKDRFLKLAATTLVRAMRRS